MLFEIYTDGSSFIKGERKECSSAFMIYCNDKLIVSGGAYYNPGTNNRGEVMAVLLGLRCLHDRLKRIDIVRLKPPYNVRIVGDSLLTIEGCRSWIYSWIKHSKNGTLINSSNEPVINGDVFKDIYKKYTSNELFNIEFLHVNSHKLDAGFDKYEIAVLDYFAKRSNGINTESLPRKVFENASFKAAMKTYVKTNKTKIEQDELLRMLIHNKRCDELAGKYIRKKNSMKPIILNGTEG